MRDARTAVTDVAHNPVAGILLRAKIRIRIRIVRISVQIFIHKEIAGREGPDMTIRFRVGDCHDIAMAALWRCCRRLVSHKQLRFEREGPL